MVLPHAVSHVRVPLFRSKRQRCPLQRLLEGAAVCRLKALPAPGISFPRCCL